MMDQNQLVIRSFSPDQDIPALQSLVNAVEQVDQTGIRVDEQLLRSQLAPPGHDPTQDRWAVSSPDDPSVMIASAHLRTLLGSNTCEANVIVHPAWRRRGIGAALLSRAIERAHQLNTSRIEISVSTKSEAGSFLQKRGFIPLGAYTELRLTESARIPPVVWPFGYTLRTYAEVQDISILTQAMNLCYIPLWGHQEVSEVEMSAWLPGFISQGLFLVFSEKGRVVGISRTEPSPERSEKNGSPTGYIDAPGVVPQHRRLDLYRALVLTGINWLRSQGQVLIEMESWGDKLEVLKMYRELGFQDIRQLICYRMDVI